MLTIINFWNDIRVKIRSIIDINTEFLSSPLDLFIARYFIELYIVFFCNRKSSCLIFNVISALLLKQGDDTLTEWYSPQ